MALQRGDPWRDTSRIAVMLWKVDQHWDVKCITIFDVRFPSHWLLPR